jgi:hypothetical protein
MLASAAGTAAPGVQLAVSFDGFGDGREFDDLHGVVRA